MAFADAGSGSVKVIGASPFIRVNAGGVMKAGDLIGLSANAFVRADDNGGIVAEWVAGEDAASGQQGVKLYGSALVKGARYTGGTKAALYLSDTAGRCDESAGTNSIRVGHTVDADSVWLNPQASALAATGTTYTSGAVTLNDNLLLKLGSDGDGVALNRAATLAADTTLASVIVGTPVVQAMPANSTLLSNITASGDIVMMTNTGGNSLEAIRIDSSAQQIHLGHGVMDVMVANGSGIVVGALTQQTLGGIIPEAQVQGTAVTDATLALGMWSTTDSDQAYLMFAKSGNATIGSKTIVANGESLGGILWVADDGVDYASQVAQIGAVISAAPGVGDTPGAIFFATSADGAETTTERMRINHLGNVAIGATNSHANMLGPGLIIAQAGNDDLAIALKSTDVSTGLTSGTIVTDVAVDDYFTVSKFAAATGGTLIQAIGENAAVTTNLKIESYGGQAHTTHTTAGRSLIEFFAAQHDGANAPANLSDTANAVGIRLYTGGAEVTKVMFDENGEIWNDGTVTAFDDEDDVALVRAFETVRAEKGFIANQWDGFVNANQDRLVELGILGDPADGGRPLVNTTKLQRLLNGAVWQLYSDLMDVVAAMPKAQQAKLSARMQSRLVGV